MIKEGNEVNNKMSVTELKSSDSTVHTIAHSHNYGAKLEKGEIQSVRKHTQEFNNAGILLLNTACQYQGESSFDSKPQSQETRANMLRSVAVRGINQVS